MDTILRLFSPQGQQVAFNDDFGQEPDGRPSRNSRIMYTCQQPGQYRIVATVLWPTLGDYRRTGPFDLIVNQK